LTDNSINGGQRLTVVRAEVIMVFIPGAFPLYASTAKTFDYHDKMDGQNFNKLLKNQLILGLTVRGNMVIGKAFNHNKQQYNVY
jgi:hypothetical protein